LTVSQLPALNASLNALCTILLLLGYAAIRRDKVTQHKFYMLGAVTVSAAFLTSYLIYHYHIGSKSFPGTVAVRYAYLSLLLTHVVLAAVQVPLIITTLIFALLGKFERHRKIAWPTYCIWMYVSVTGVVIYLLLYQIYS